MIKLSLKNGFYYKGTIISEDNYTITIIDIKNREVTISKDQIAVKEEIDDKSDS